MTGCSPQWLLSDRQASVPQIILSIDDVIARYWSFVEQHYQKQGVPTGEVDNIRYALRPLHQLYGDTTADDFGPLKLKALRHRMVEQRLSRRVINQRIGIIKRLFRWAVSEELVLPSVMQGLSSVSGLQKGRSAAKEREPVKPEDEAVVEATLPYLPPVVREMVDFQRWTGCRPGEVCQLRPNDVSRLGTIWEYRPMSHKTEHRDQSRVILIGPRAQGILEPLLASTAPDAFCFAPTRSQAIRNATLRERRLTKVRPSQRNRSRLRPQRTPGARYTPNSYLRAVHRACERARVERWSPNQLRHLAATKLRATFGLEAAQAVLGHAKADVTQIYAARDLARAAHVIGQVG
jgi:integrase